MEYDYYRLLGVDFKASVSEIKHAFRTKAKHFHPDRQGGEAGHEFFQVLNEAYKTLSDPDRRTQYDRKMGWGKADLIQDAPVSRAEKRAERRRRNTEYSRSVHSMPEAWDPPTWVKYGFYMVGVIFGSLVCYFSVSNILSGIWNPIMLWVSFLGFLVLLDALSGLFSGQPVLSRRLLKFISTLYPFRLF